MRLFQRLVFILLAFAASVRADDAPDASKFFDSAKHQVADMRKQLADKDADNARLEALRGQNNDLAAQAQAIIAERTPALATLDARVEALGAEPADGTREAADIAAQRKDIERQRANIDADIKRAKSVVVDSSDLAAAIAQARRSNFQARLSQRTASPLMPTFWRDLDAGLARDRGILGTVGTGVRDSLGRAFAQDRRMQTTISLGFGLFVLLFLRWFAEHALMRWTANRVPHGRLRRSALAVAIVTGMPLFSGIGVSIMLAGLGDALDDSSRTLCNALAVAVVWGSFVAGLARALLATARPSWRLPKISDDLAQRLRALPWLSGLAVALGVFVNRFYALAGTGVSMAMLGDLGISVVYALVIGWSLARVARVATAPGDAARPAWIGVPLALLWFGTFATFATALAGYIELAHQIARQMMFAGIVSATLYLLVHFIEDLFAGAVQSRAGWMRRTLGLSQHALDQWSVLCSGVLRVAAIALGLVLMLRPLETDPSTLLAQAVHFEGGLAIGQISVTPGAIVTAALVLLAGITVVRHLQRWLLGAYLPTTRLDEAMRSSITTLLGWLGIVVVIAFALSALGLSLDRIAWVASALSVGIGFGLQAIVQNFVSGLILLVERPVKVGDWVVIGDIEGDIRRVNVRATEIQLGDRSTAIVPNSQLITQSVRNVTLSNAQGRVLLKLPLPLDCDPARVRAIALEAVGQHPGVLDKPAASVLLDGIAGGALVFAVAAYIANPRQAGGVRSDLLIEIISRLRAQGIALSSPLQVAVGGVAAAAQPAADSTGEQPSATGPA